MTFTTAYAKPEPARTEIDALPGVTLLEFGAPWCGYCIGAQELIEDVLAAHPGVRHLKIEDGSGLPLGRSFRVKLWPTLVLLRDGSVLQTWVRPDKGEDIEHGLATALGGTRVGSRGSQDRRAPKFWLSSPPMQSASERGWPSS